MNDTPLRIVVIAWLAASLTLAIAESEPDALDQSEDSPSLPTNQSGYPFSFLN